MIICEGLAVWYHFGTHATMSRVNDYEYAHLEQQERKIVVIVVWISCLDVKYAQTNIRPSNTNIFPAAG